MLELYKRLKHSPLLIPLFAFLFTFIAGVVLIAGGVITINNTENINPAGQIDALYFTNKNGQVGQLHVEVADTPSTWEQGLMWRTTLAADSGMLFVFDTIQPRTFWMQNTLIPLDIIFLDENLRVVKIYADTKANQTSEVYPSQLPIKYALETNAGWSASVGLHVGDQINLK